MKKAEGSNGTSGRLSGRLPENLLTQLAPGCPGLLLTNGVDGHPASAFTWLVAVNGQSVRFIVDHGSTALGNLERDPRAALQVIAEAVALVKGRAVPLKARIEAAGPLGMALWSLDVAEVRDQSWPEVVVLPLKYEWAPARRREGLVLEAAVLAEMAQWRG